MFSIGSIFQSGLGLRYIQSELATSIYCVSKNINKTIAHVVRSHMLKKLLK